MGEVELSIVLPLIRCLINICQMYVEKESMVWSDYRAVSCLRQESVSVNPHALEILSSCPYLMLFKFDDSSSRLCAS